MEPAHYQKLYALLKNRIQVGYFKEGDLLPSENDLSKKHNIARMTVRRALMELANEGYIKKVKGKGSIVIATRKGCISVSQNREKKLSFELTQNLPPP
jgi:GntR family transcriptional regulator/GntR family frlABCD operon transcriptional regulator